MRRAILSAIPVLGLVMIAADFDCQPYHAAQWECRPVIACGVSLGIARAASERLDWVR